MKLLKLRKSKTDCKPGEECISGTCEGPQTECNGDAECTRSEKCIDGFCRSTGSNGLDSTNGGKGGANGNGQGGTNGGKGRGIGDLVKTAANLASKANSGAGGNGPGSTNGGKGGGGKGSRYWRSCKHCSEFSK